MTLKLNENEIVIDESQIKNRGYIKDLVEVSSLSLKDRIEIFRKLFR